jgi:hypothetical protein
MRKYFGLVVALLLVWAGPASADTILFNPEGTGVSGAIEIDALDQAPGNALAQDITVNTAFPGQQFTLNYQANLAAANLAGNQVFAQGDNGNFFTFAAVFGEQVDFAFGIPGVTPVTLLFSEAAGYPLNAFNMYATASAGSDLSGQGFTTGTLILSGHMVDLFENFTFPSTNPASAVPLDQTNDNDYPGVTTLSGIGNANIVIQIDYADQGYFPGMNTGGTLTFAITNTSIFAPFTAADPSAAFSSNAVANADIPGVSSTDPINAWSGPNTVLNADANTSFTVTQVPEPGLMTLLGMGMLGIVVQRRRAQNRVN